MRAGEASGKTARRSRWGVIAFIVAMVVVAYGMYLVEINRDRSAAATLAKLRGKASGYNVVLITLDTTRADRLGCYGHAGAATPNLDRLADEGVRFADAVSCVPITLPAHASILTGLNPPTHGVRNNGQFNLGAEHATLASALKARGYETAAFLSAFVLDRRYGLARGFDVYDDAVEPPPGANVGGTTNERPANLVTEAALRWLRGRESKQPCFLWVHYYDPHTPYTPPGRFAATFSQSPYDGEIAFMDEQVGRLLTEIEQRLGRQRTIVIAVGDHGESLGEHGEDTHSLSIYGATQRVPLLLWAPGVIAKGGVVDGVVASVVDVAPTVFDLVGVDVAAPLDGASLLGIATTPQRSVYMETLATYFEHGWAPLYALRRHAEKYIEAPTPEYYDLSADAQELNNRWGGQTPAPARALASELEKMLAKMPSVQDVAAGAAEVDPETLRRLQALGYMGGEGPDEEPDAEEALADPKEMMATWAQLGQVKELRKTRQFDAAWQAVAALLEHSPKDPSVLREAGTICLQMNRFEDAERYLRESVQGRPDPDVWQLLGQLASRGGQFDEAVTLLDEALKLDPKHGASLIAKGDIRAMQGDYEGALRFYDQARREDPTRAAQIAQQRIAQTQARMRNP